MNPNHQEQSAPDPLPRSSPLSTEVQRQQQDIPTPTNASDSIPRIFAEILPPICASLDEDISLPSLPHFHGLGDFLGKRPAPFPPTHPHSKFPRSDRHSSYPDRMHPMRETAHSPLPSKMLPHSLPPCSLSTFKDLLTIRTLHVRPTQKESFVNRSSHTPPHREPQSHVVHHTSLSHPAATSTSVIATAIPALTSVAPGIHRAHLEADRARDDFVATKGWPQIHVHSDDDYDEATVESKHQLRRVVRRRKATICRFRRQAYARALEAQLVHPLDANRHNAHFTRANFVASLPGHADDKFKDRRIRRERMNKFAAENARVRRESYIQGLEAQVVNAYLQTSGEDVISKSTHAASSIRPPNDTESSPNNGRHSSALSNRKEADLSVKDVFYDAALLHTGSQAVNPNVPQAKRLYERLTGVHPDAANNLAVILQNEVEDGPELEMNLAKAVNLYEIAVSVSDGDKARANLALLLWRGPKPIRRDIPRAIKLLTDAADMLGLPRYKVLLARVLLSAESGAHRDPVRARSLLEAAVKGAMFLPAMRDLAALLSRGGDGIARDPVRASRLHALCKQRADGDVGTHFTDNFEEPQLVLWEESRHAVEEKLRAAKAKQSQVFLLTLGGAGRGKTSVVRSLRGMEFVAEHNPTELAAVTQFNVMPGGRHLSDDELRQLAFNKDSLTANLSRVPDSTRGLRGGQDRRDKVQWARPSASPDDHWLDSLGEVSTLELGTPSAETFWRDFPNVLSKVSDGFSERPLPTGPTGALVQCWDLGGQSQYVMAHTLFVKNGNVFVFVVNLKKLWAAGTRLDEIRELCRWMQLVHALVENAASVRPIIVGTHKDSCENVKEVRRILYEGLKNEVGAAIYNSWVKVDIESWTNNEIGEGCFLQFVAIENSTAVTSPTLSGLSELEQCVKRAADSVAAARQEVPARWVAFVEELEKSTKDFLNKSDISCWADGFPAFGTDTEERNMDALQALRYFNKLGRIVLFEVSEEEVYLFPRPAVILDVIRQVTGPEELARRRLSQEHAKMLDRGLLTSEGLKALWHEVSAEMRSFMLDLLCRFDLLMRLPPAHDNEGSCGELIAIPALLPKCAKGLQCARRMGESELRVTTTFTDAFPPGVIGSLISHLHKDIGGGRTRAGFLGSEAAVLTSRVELKETGRVMVTFSSEQRRLDWKIFAKDPVRVVRGCLKSLEDFVKCPLRGMQLPWKHVLRTNCRSDMNGCGEEWAVEFPLSAEWIYDSSCRGLPNVEGECVSSCEELWTLMELLPDMFRVAGHESAKSVRVGGERQQFDVFISHAGIRDGDPGDKLYLARPLYNVLRERGMRCFLDKVSLEPGDGGVEKMIEAMETADIGIFILSPEFAARRWTMRELQCFLRRQREASASGDVPPIIIPVFYRMGIQECRRLDPERYMLKGGRNLFVKEGFYDESRQGEAPTSVVKESMKALSCITGIENDEGASNDMEDPFAAQARGALVQRIVMWVMQRYEYLQSQRARGSEGANSIKPE